MAGYIIQVGIPKYLNKDIKKYRKNITVIIRGS